MALPFLPGNNFTDPTKTRFHRSQSLGWKNGYALPVTPKTAIGGEPIVTSKLTREELDELANFKPSLTYGQKVRAPPGEFIPAHVGFDKKVLLFFGYFKQTVHESATEYYRVRPVRVYYYLEDDSIAVVEPVVENSGIPQGKLIKRQRLPKDDLGNCWNWKDFNLGINLTFYGKVIRICNCDEFTKEFMASEGILLNSPEEIVKDPYTENRKQPPRTYNTPSDFDKLNQFLVMDRKVLRFFCVWDDRDSMFGEMRPYILHYYLVDDTVEVREIHTANDGRDPFPVLIQRQKLPKNRKATKSSFPRAVLEITENEISDWFRPSDLMVGRTVTMLGRRFLLYDCDQFTKEYYAEKFGVSDFTSVNVAERKGESPKHVIPPYNGFGSLDDSLQSCLSLIPQPPKKDFIRMLENGNKVLRYSAIMESVRPEDKDRKFIIIYRLADDMITIYEPPVRNAGILCGKFLQRTRVQKPGTPTDNPEFYSPGDFYIGAKIHVFKHRFIITDADEYVLKYLEANSDEFPKETILSLRQKLGKSFNMSQENDDGNNGNQEKPEGIKTEYQRRF
ncbi:EF-hand domain-containing protein 1-like [Xenia sp. Carnegie-2017]|uniref:EF-hand domain-containing protein 1-like n=1 Tax=Xenia sp. Carnegie-2017 TaxID=2897299 RepID=UPI001F03B6EA|nr:EF-hand domain-containing protein 1-like [Xenia sp. Carnegie-2017]